MGPSRNAAASFVSVSGEGLAVAARIEPGKHLESFHGLVEHFRREYELEADLPCKDVSRLRFVSYDPGATYNADAQVFVPVVTTQQELPDDR